MHVFDSEKPKVDALRSSAAHEERREKMLRWLFWTLFLLGTLGALIWKLVYPSIN